MISKRLSLIVAAGLAAACSSAAHAGAYVMDFDVDPWGDPIPSNAVMSLQYAAWGVAVSANPMTGPSGSGAGTGNWATNTDLVVTTADVGVTARTGYGNLLHSLGGWLQENGDPSFELNFLNGCDSISIVFTGIAAGNGWSGMGVYDADTGLLSNVIRVQDPAQGGAFTQTLSLSNLGYAQSIVVMPGTYDDWVGVDDIAFTDGVIPAPTAGGMLALAGIIGTRRRRR